MEYLFNIRRAIKLQEETGINILDKNIDLINLSIERQEKYEEALTYEKYIKKNNEKLQEYNENIFETTEEEEKFKKLKNKHEPLIEEYVKKLDILIDEIKSMDFSIEFMLWDYAYKCIPIFAIDLKNKDEIFKDEVDEFYRELEKAKTSGFMRIIEENTKQSNDDNMEKDKGK